MITVYDVEQGSDEWIEARRGILTASEVKLIVTPTLKKANNDKSRAHLWELLAQRVSGFVEPKYVSDDMLRGSFDESAARDIYGENYAEVEEAGFIVNDDHGFPLGYSPDGLVGDDGLIEIKSRLQKFQVEAIVNGEIPKQHMLQMQTGLLVTGRKWCDYVQYCAGLPLFVQRVLPNQEMRMAIIEAGLALEDELNLKADLYANKAKDLVETERVDDDGTIEII